MRVYQIRRSVDQGYTYVPALLVIDEEYDRMPIEDYISDINFRLIDPDTGKEFEQRDYLCTYHDCQVKECGPTLLLFEGEDMQLEE